MAGAPAAGATEAPTDEAASTQPLAESRTTRAAAIVKGRIGLSRKWREP